MSSFLDSRTSRRRKQITGYKPILDFILDHAQGDERPYLEVDVLGYKFLGLLDSGASRCFLGQNGWEVLRKLNLFLDTNRKSVCSMANGEKSESIGTVELPIRVRDRIRLVEVVVLPQLPHSLILGYDFWIAMGIVPDLRHDEWHFASDAESIFCITEGDLQTKLKEEEQFRLDSLVSRYKAMMGDGIGCTNLVEHRIVTKSNPVRQRPYRVSPVLQKLIEEEIDEMLRMGVIEPSNSPWASPVVLVRKKNTDKFRFCVDYRILNSKTERDSYPLPLVSETLDKLKDAKYLSSLDIKSAYWQVPIEESSKPLTAFICHKGLFQFRRMPFGLHNAPATWQRLIDRVLTDLSPYVFVYLDDVVVVTQTFEEHVQILEEVFKRLQEAGITISWDKCQFCRPEMKYLGYVVDRRGLRVDPDKVKAMLELPRPRTVTEVRRLVGSFSWYRRFVPDFSSIISPITALTKKNKKFVWTPECEEAFVKIRELLVQAPILSCPDYSKKFVIQTDASGYGIGAVLTQPQEGGEKVICYLSRSLTKQERLYTTTEREMLALVWAIQKLRPYIEGVPFTVITDHHALKWLLNLKDPTGRLGRWSIKLQQYDFEIEHRRGRDMDLPDMLSRTVPVLDSIELQLEGKQTRDKWYEQMKARIEQKPLNYLNWRSQDEKIYKYVKQDYPELSSEDSWKLVVPKDGRVNLIKAAHDPPTSGHMGVYKTYSRLAEKYYWPKMRQDVASYIRHCHKCAAYKTDPQGKQDQLVSHPKPSRPWEMISTDLMGPLPRSTKGNSFILVVTDYFSKFSMIFPLRKATTSAIIKYIEESVFLVFGVPRVLLCDNGPQYRSAEFKKFVGKYDCVIKFNANYHPRANPTERQNRTLKTMLAMYVKDNHRLWDADIHRLACALRTARQETTKVSPYFVNFGRNMCLSGKDYDRVTLNLGEDNDSTQLNSRNEAFMKLYADVKRRLVDAGEKGVLRYNLRKREADYTVGQRVLRKNYVLSDAAKYFSKKLAPKYVGPFVVRRRVSPWTYELVDDNGRHQGVWHIKDLKEAPYLSN